MDGAQHPETLTITRILEAPREAVWRAWTDPAQLAQWWGPFGPDCTSAEVDLRAGGAFRVRMRGPDGTEVDAASEILDLAPQERIVFKGDPNPAFGCGGGMPPLAVVTLLLSDVAQGTRMILTVDFPDAAAKARAIEEDFAVNCGRSFDALEAGLRAGRFG